MKRSSLRMAGILMSLLFVIGLPLGCTPETQTPTEPVITMVVHGGAGTILKENMTPEQEKVYRDKLTEARTLRDGHAPAPHATTWSARAQNINRSVLLETRLWIVLIAWCVLWLWLVLAFFKRTPKWRWPILITLTIFLLAAGSVGWDVSQRPGVDTGVVIADGAVLRTSNSQTAPAASPDALAQGQELTVLAHRERWIEVKLSSGATGWLPRQDVEVIEPLLKGPFKNGSFLP